MDVPGSATRFDGLAAVYSAYRPTYPPAVVEFVEKELSVLPSARIIDVGSGTGISAELFLKAGYAVTCVEPGADMFARATANLSHYPLARFVQSRAESTGLPDADADLVLAGHSFHWFDVAACRREFARILKPGGWVALLWNSRDERDAFTREYYERIEPFASEHPHLDPAANESRARSLFGNDYRVQRFPNPARWSLSELLGFVFSASYLPKRETAEGGVLIAEVEQLFARYATGGKISFAFVSEIYYGHSATS
jgi:SAM-dependent methyltransferase